MCECFVYIRCSSTVKLQTLFLKSLTMRKLYNGLKAQPSVQFYKSELHVFTYMLSWYLLGYRNEPERGENA